MNVNWVKENKSMIDSLNPSKSMRFENLLQRARGNFSGDAELLRSCDYLDLAYDMNKLHDSHKKQNLESILDAIFSNSFGQKPKSLSEQKKRLNKIGEIPGEPRMLNLMDRIEALYQTESKEKDDPKQIKTKTHVDNVDEDEFLIHEFNPRFQIISYRPCLSFTFFE